MSKLQGGIFIGSQITKLLSDLRFQEKLNGKEFAASTCFVGIVKGFLGNKKNKNYESFVRMILRHFWAPIWFFLSFILNDEERERFHLLRIFENR